MRVLVGINRFLGHLEIQAGPVHIGVAMGSSCDWSVDHRHHHHFALLLRPVDLLLFFLFLLRIQLLPGFLFRSFAPPSHLLFERVVEHFSDKLVRLEPLVSSRGQL